MARYIPVSSYIFFFGGAADRRENIMHPTLFRGRLSDREIVENFLALPAESLPSASWEYPDEGFASGPAWPHLSDFLLPAAQQKLEHFGDPIRLRAARAGWEKGVVVHAG